MKDIKQLIEFKKLITYYKYEQLIKINEPNIYISYSSVYGIIPKDNIIRKICSHVFIDKKYYYDINNLKGISSMCNKYNIEYLKRMIDIMNILDKEIIIEGSYNKPILLTNKYLIFILSQLNME